MTVERIRLQLHVWHVSILKPRYFNKFLHHIPAQCALGAANDGKACFCRFHDPFAYGISMQT